MKKLLFLVLLAVIVAIGLYNAAPSRFTEITSIGDILNDPELYKEKVVTVRGKVNDSKGIYKVGYYELSDQTGKIAIVTLNAFAPQLGEVISVKGRVVQVLRSNTISKIIIYQTE